MTKHAADIAADLSEHKTKDVKPVETDVDDLGGGIALKQDDVIADPGGYSTGTPFDLVHGRPQVDFWGPFETYAFVTTPFGEYAIEAGKILRLEQHEVWNPKTGQLDMRTTPVYEVAPPELIAYVS